MQPAPFRTDWMIAAFLLGLLLFNRPFIEIFDVGAETTVLGIPLLFLYIFAAWSVVIALMVGIMEFPDGRETGRHGPRVKGPGDD